MRKQVEQSTLALNKALGANCVLFDKPLIKSTELKGIVHNFFIFGQF